MNKQTPITIRDIIRETIIKLYKHGDISSYDEHVDCCVQKIKQKLAHMRRVLFSEIEKTRLIQPLENVPGSETISIPKRLSTDDILDIVYIELDHCIEGLEQDKKNLTDMSNKGE